MWLFISDLHLSARQPDKVALLHRFLEVAAGQCRALYVLGDLFDLWLGDDDSRAPHAEVTAALARFRARGPALFVMHGNHDFLLGEDFAAATGARLLGDYHVESFDGARTLLTHGDLLCTEDVLYQAFRQGVHDPAFQRNFLSKSLDERLAIANDLRGVARASTAEKPEAIMDVTESAVCESMREHGVRRLIHGHTHRPGHHVFELDGEPAERFVLGDWYAQENVLIIDGGEARLVGIGKFIG